MMERIKSMSLWAPLPLRLAVGVVFMYHGYGKLFGGLAGFAQGLAQMGMPAPHFMAALAAGGEFFGGLFLLLGLFTRLAAIPPSVVMLVALFKVHLPGGQFAVNKGGIEFVLVLFLILVSLMLSGSDPLSLDGLMARLRKPAGSKSAA